MRDLDQLPGPGLLTPEQLRRLETALAGRDVARSLRIADLQPGDVGVLQARVEHMTPQRTYDRKRGGQGTTARVTISDGTGAIDLVLWDEETGRLADGTFETGATLALRGATVKAGYRGGLELGLGSARVERLAGAPEKAGQTLAGTLVEVGPARVAGDPPDVTITADATLRLPDGAEARVVLSGPCLLAVRQAGAGARLRLVGVQANPALPGWHWTLPGATCTSEG